MRTAQLAAQTNGAGLSLATQLIRGKIKKCQETLETFGRSPARDARLAKLQRELDDLDRTPADIGALRLVEARAELAYFLCWQEVVVTWEGIGRKPNPPEWHRAGLHQGVLQDVTNRHATHPANAMLNYACAVLESQVRIAAASYGLDPTIGFLHASHPGRLALVHDLMEPLRPRIGRLVLDFARANTFSSADFLPTKTGACRLHPQLARRIAVLGAPAESIKAVIELASPQLAEAHRSRAIPEQAKLNGSEIVRRGRPSRHTRESST